MVHNGIEYGDMQLICEAYHLMKDSLKMNNDEMSLVSNIKKFFNWTEFIFEEYVGCKIMTLEKHGKLRETLKKNLGKFWGNLKECLMKYVKKFMKFWGNL